MASNCNDPFELTRGSHNATKVTVRRVRVTNEVRIGIAVDNVLYEPLAAGGGGDAELRCDAITKPAL